MTENGLYFDQSFFWMCLEAHLLLFFSGGGNTESQYLSKSTNNQINIYFSRSRSNTM